VNRNLDVLRAFAVSAVVVCHLLRLGGFKFGERIGPFGVLLFFVHTSLVLMLSMDRQKMSYWQFIVRRIFRIYPLSVLVVLFYFSTGLTDQTFPNPALAAHTLVPHLFLFQNVVNLSSMPVVLWSLPFEMQMYLLLPVLFVFCTSLRKCLLAWGIAIAVIALQRFTIGSTPQVFDFIPCFIPGVIAFVRRDQSPKFNAMLWPVFLVALLGIYLAGNFPGANWLFCLLVGFAIPLFREIPEGVVTAGAAKIAKYSYGIYLTHMLALDMAFRISGPVRWLVFITLGTGLPVLLFHLIESPMINLGKRFTAVPLAKRATA
jgi:peptidoglycan/LPS O-acetylase OafA/YrhL